METDGLTRSNVQPNSDGGAVEGPRRGRVVTAVVVALGFSSIVLVSLVARTPEQDLTTGLAPGVSVFVDPSGRSDGDGSLDRPLDLETALSAKGPVRQGATVWLRGGTYRGAFRSDLTGSGEQPIVVRPYPGEHVILDSAPFAEPALAIHGAWTTYRDLEVLNSSAGRESAQANSSQPTDLTRGPGLDIHGPHTKFVALVVHDLAGGLDIWSDAIGSEATGNIIYNNGWKSGDRNNGHGIYTQNKDGVRKLTDNIIFNQFAAGVHAYGSDAAYLDNLLLEGNVSFNNGLIAHKYDRNLLIGGGRPARHPVLIGNHTYYSRGLRNGQNNIGYQAGCADLEARDNVFAASDFGFSLEMVNCTGSVEHNTFIGEVRAVEGPTLINHMTVKSRFPKNTYVEQQPTGVQVFVRPSRSERGRANIIVYNWAQGRAVSVDLSAANLEMGSRFVIRDAQNYFGNPVATGTYSGAPVQLPMSGLTVAAPFGDGLTTPAHTGPEFAVFVLTPAPPPTSFLSRAVSALRRAL
jgi:hypothetical protein